MRKLSIIILPIFLLFIYIFSAMYSFHQVHKAIYYNDKQLSENYIEWVEVKKNFKDFFNANLLNKMSNEKEFRDLGELGILVTGLAGKIVDYAIDTYINPEGLGLLIQKSDKKSEIRKPNLATLIGGISIMNFDGLSSFHVNFETDEEEIPVHFKRIGIKWKIVEIEFSKNIFDEMKLN
tara:strand:+ start:73 stop:609 length:537 start_codon:yes stop_codon:yes gene_type:complete